jgi:hypothetical protein
MRRIGIVVALAAVAAVIPAMASGQGASPGAWCGGSYGAEGTNFAECGQAPANPQVAGPGSGISGQSGPAQPQYPSSEVTFKDGKAFHNQQQLNLQWAPSPDRSREIQAD